MRVTTALIITVSAATHLVAQRADTVVRRATAPVHAGVATLQREIGIGISAGDEHYMLGAISDIAVAANGSIFVWDASVPTVRMYDAAGKFVRLVGARGSGPGEYRSGSAIAFGKGGRFLVWDPGNARINTYSPAGDALESWPTRGGSGSASGRRLMTTDTAGNAWVNTTIYNRAAANPVPRRGWLKFGPDGALKDTVFPPAGPTESRLDWSSGGMTVSFNVPFAPVRHSAVSPLGYIVSAYSDRIALDLHDGDKITSIRRETPVQPVTAAERDSARADVTTKMQKSAPGWSWSGAEIPKVKPAHLGVLVADDGNLWVRIAQGPRKADAGAPPTVSMGGGAARPGGVTRGSTWSCPSNGWGLYDIYEPSGRYLGQVRVPEEVDPIIMRGDYVWAATCNEDEVPVVTRYKIAWR